MRKRKKPQVVIDTDKLRVELARSRTTKTQLAAKLSESPTTLGSWLRGDHPGPDDLAERIEAALGLPQGTLAMPVPPTAASLAIASSTK